VVCDDEGEVARESGEVHMLDCVVKLINILLMFTVNVSYALEKENFSGTRNEIHDYGVESLSVNENI
jgi:hypothetical protein